MTSDVEPTFAASSAARGGDHARTPYRVGQILDWGFGVPPVQDQLDATQMAFEEAHASGLIDRPVELVTRLVEGLPYASFGTLLREYRELVALDCLAIIGPHITDQTLALREEVQRAGVPTLVNSGTMGFYGDFHFLTPTGTFADEAALMAAWIRRQGADDVVVIRDDNPLGEEYVDSFRRAARSKGVGIGAVHVVDTYPSTDDVHDVVGRCRAADPASLAFMGFGVGMAELFRAINAQCAAGWVVPRVMSSIYMCCTPEIGYGFQRTDFEGWAGIDQFHEGNEVFTSLYERFAVRFGRRPPHHPYLAMGYDLGNTTATALSLARPATPQGVRDGFERIRMLPAAIGGPGNVISFGPYDHRGYKGPYIVMRTMRDGENVIAE